MSDYEIALQDDWMEFKKEVYELLKEKPNLTVHQIADITGGDFEDILWILKTNR